MIGIADEGSGELPRAFIVKKPGMESISAEEISEFVNERVAPHKHLNGGVEFRSDIPKNHLGKVLRRELGSQYNKTKSRQ